MSVWVPAIAALVASVLTWVGACGLESMRRRAEARSETIRQRRVAYVAFVEAANGMLMLGQTLRSVLLAQSGLADSIAQVVRLRKPVDPLELAWRVADEMRPVLDAQAGVLSCGTPRAASATTQVVAKASEYLQAATAMTKVQRGLIGVIPWVPSPEQDAELATRLAAAGLAVQKFVAVMREDLGERALEVAPESGHDPRHTL